MQCSKTGGQTSLRQVKGVYLDTMPRNRSELTLLDAMRSVGELQAAGGESRILGSRLDR